MSTPTDIRELDYDTVRDIVKQLDMPWPIDNSPNSRLFRLQSQRIATEAFRRGMLCQQCSDAAAAMKRSREQS